MRTEVPVFKRGCFCLPLRRSLIAWGYFKLFIATILLIFCLEEIYLMINTILRIKQWLFTEEVIIITVVFAIVIVDIILHILFIIGAHKKEVKFLRIYYYYSLILLVLMLLIDLFCVGVLIHFMVHFRYIDIIIFTFSSGVVMFLNLLTQAYVTLLVRSEIVKLNDIGHFRFVNNAAEAECKLNIEHPHEESVEIDEKHEKDENKKENTDTEDNNGYIA